MSKVICKIIFAYIYNYYKKYYFYYFRVRNKIIKLDIAVSYSLNEFGD